MGHRIAAVRADRDTVFAQTNVRFTVIIIAAPNTCVESAFWIFLGFTGAGRIIENIFVTADGVHVFGILVGELGAELFGGALLIGLTSLVAHRGLHLVFKIEAACAIAAYRLGGADAAFTLATEVKASPMGLSARHRDAVTHVIDEGAAGHALRAGVARIVIAVGDAGAFLTFGAVTKNKAEEIGTARVEFIIAQVRDVVGAVTNVVGLGCLLVENIVLDAGVTFVRPADTAAAIK